MTNELDRLLLIMQNILHIEKVAKTTREAIENEIKKL